MTSTGVGGVTDGVASRLVGAALALTGSGLLVACGGQAEPETVRVAASYGFEASDPRQLMAYADDAFVGRVLEQTDVIDRGDSMPTTVFDVEVITAIKGAESATMSVGQDGGLSADGEQLFVFEGDRLLEPGRTYVFVTHDDDGLAVLVPRYGNKPAGDAATTWIAALRRSA